MIVETYEIEEVAEQEPEQNEACAVMIEELGLDGQKKLRGDTPTKDAFPYRKITQEEFAVYAILCPQHTKLKDYSEGPIPLRVLQVAAYAKPLFNELEVWHPGTQIKDPVLIGCKGSEYVWNREHYVLARWGDTLDEWPALLRRAFEMWRSRCLESLTAIEKQIKFMCAEACGAMDVDEFIKNPRVPSFDWRQR